MTEEHFFQIISQGESQTIEFKKSTSMMREAIETIIAFANTEGGYLIFGVADDGSVIGQDVSDGTLKDIANSIKLNSDPKIYPTIEKIQINNKSCVVVSVDESPLKPHLAFGRPFLRVGAANQRIEREQYEYLLQQRFNGYGFDYLTRDEADINDIDVDTLMEFLETANSLRNLNENLLLPTEMILEKLDILRNGKITNAALLLFGKNPEKHFVSHYEIKCGQFIDDSNYDKILNDKEFKGNLISNFKFTLSFLLDTLKTKTEKQGINRTIIFEYPESVLREALVNMIVHRDYRQNIKSTVEVRPQKVIFYNPAQMFKPTISIESLKRQHPSRPGNKLIAKIFYLMGLFENWGGGTLHIINESLKNGKISPEFSFQEGMFKLELFR
ncbi:MAG TPA: putative DNA binding domain-containing protein [Candidatus Kapabacteria bacterium]|nr:putative DNA binding domain-containing protein [Candidatus Kapabacteria bacterium]HPO63032.1 putative DNA binding domain-containing protein [Candidatus Kapabacteria bacterium]